MRRRTIAWPMRPSPINPTFMALLLNDPHPIRYADRPPPFRGRIKPCSDELAAHPVELAADIVDDVVRLQAVRQHVPGVGLHLEMMRQRHLLVEAQRVGDGKARGAELAE